MSAYNFTPPPPLKEDLPQPVIGVYVITNEINKRVYIGMSKSIFMRWAGHIKDSLDPVYDLHKDMARQGAQDFSWRMLEINTSVTIADDRETWHIAQFIAQGYWVYNKKKTSIADNCYLLEAIRAVERRRLIDELKETKKPRKSYTRKAPLQTIELHIPQMHLSALASGSNRT